MEVRLLACESLGARSLATLVRTRDRAYLIDPGVSVPPRRSKLPPHPLELAASYLARERIMAAAREADTIILTHYHHDHFTPFMFREHEWSDRERAIELYRGKRLLAKSPRRDLNHGQRLRARTLGENGFEAEEADGRDFGDVEFSRAVPHGEKGSVRGCVIMPLFRERSEGDRAGSGSAFAFAYGSDIQLLDDEAIAVLREWRPSLCIASGPPLYLDAVSPAARARAAERVRELCDAAGTLVLDHHVTRAVDYGAWLAPLAAAAEARGGRMCVGADFMGRAPLLLEARRKELFTRWPAGRSYLEAIARQDRSAREWIAAIATALERADTLDALPGDIAR